MLRTFFRNQNPPRIIRLLQETLRRIGRYPPVDILPLDVLFEDIEKRHFKMPYPVEIPDLQNMAIAEEARSLYGPVYAVPEDYVAEINNVLFCPNNSVLMTDEQEVISESLNADDSSSLRLRDFFLYKTEFVPGYSTPLRSARSDYYHTLVDHIPRLLALDRPPYDELDKIQLLCPGELRPMEKFFIDRLGPDNLQVVKLKRNTLYRLEKVLFTPFKTRKFAGYLPEFYRERYRQHLLPERSSRREHRLFVSRPEPFKRTIENQEELRDCLEEFGFKTIVPEQLSLARQIELFYDAEIVVGAHGPGLTNMLFSPHLKVIELFPTAYVIPHYFYLSRSLGHEYNYWCGTNGHPDIRSFTVDTSRIGEMVREMNVTAPSTTPEKAY